MPPADGYQFVEVGSRKDKTFNQLFGVNDSGRIAGSFNSGAKGHPYQGDTITPPYAQGNVKTENFPHAAQTEVFGLNDDNVQVGDYSTQNKTPGTDNSFGWYFNGSFHEVVFPTKHNASPVQDELSGVNNHDIAVGTYENSSHVYESFTFNIKNRKFSALTLPGVPSSENVEVSGINNAGDVVGLVGEEALPQARGRRRPQDRGPGRDGDDRGRRQRQRHRRRRLRRHFGGIHGFIWRIGGSLST